MEPRPDGRGKESGDVAGAQNIMLPQWSPGLMAGGRKLKGFGSKLGGMAPQWSPGLMAGGRRMVATGDVQLTIAAMEPRPDGRGKMR